MIISWDQSCYMISKGIVGKPAYGDNPDWL